jgi:hypothetical protein
MFALGVINPDPSWEGQPHTSPRLYFTAAFLDSPPALWEVRREPTKVPPYTEWPQGTLVKCCYAKMPTVWVLTGLRLTTCEAYEGKWPD